MIVIDANILIAFALSDEPLHTQANKILSTWNAAGTPLVAPQLFRSEITAVVRKVVYQQRMSYQQGKLLLDQPVRYPVMFYEDDLLLKSAYDIADQFNRPRAYDAQYLALAQRLSCDFWTADERLVNAVSSKLPNVYCCQPFDLNHPAFIPEQTP